MKKQTSLAIVPGSLQQVSQTKGITLAESFLDVDVLLVVDMSGSMGCKDAPGGLSRYEAAENELARLQGELPGKIGVIAFSSYPVFVPNGKPPHLDGSTDMAGALQFVKVADDTGIKFILISDGEPNDKEGTLKVAKTFKTKIDTIFIGPEMSSGKAFLDKLASLTGGKSVKTKEVAMLAQPVKALLQAG